MAHETIIYGMIDAGELEDATPPNVHHDLNRQVIASLPAIDSSPALTRDMFSIAGSMGTFRSQIIHFGASFASLEKDWHVWLEKFEALLHRLYWFGAVVHLESEFLEGDYQYQWLVSDESLLDGLMADPIMPVESWEFSGGPRRFDL